MLRHPVLFAIATALTARAADADAAAAEPPSPPLWPGANATAHARDEALLHGVEYLYGRGMQDDANFFTYGFDYLLCLQGVSHRALNPVVAQRALDIGRALGRKWKREFTQVPEDAQPHQVQRLLFGLFALERLGMHFPMLKNELRQYTALFEVEEFLHFHPSKHDPAQPPERKPPRFPPRGGGGGGGGAKADAPQVLTAPSDELPASGAKGRSALALWSGALVRTFVAEKLGLPLGGGFAESTSYDDVLRWRPGLLPYGAARDAAHFHEQVVAASSLAQTLSDFGRLQLQPETLRPELEFASANVSAAVASNDVDLAAALVDVLRSFGVDESSASAALREGVDFLLRRQRADGSWAAAAASPQAVYHPTCSALLALSPHEHHGFGPAMPRLLQLLRRQAGLEDDGVKEEL